MDTLTERRSLATCASLYSAVPLQSTGDLRTWLQADSLASPSALPGGAREPTTNAICGRPRGTWLASFDHASHSWKTSPALFPADIFIPCSLTLPQWGMTRAGELYQQRTPARLTLEKDCGYLPTPRSINAFGIETSTGAREKYMSGPTLTQVIRRSAMLPTPAAQEAGWKVGGEVEIVDKNGDPPAHANQRWYDRKTGRIVQKGLTQVVTMLPTPAATEARQGYQNRNNGKRGSQKSLTTVVVEAEAFATPRASDAHGHQIQPGKQGGLGVNQQIGGKLNPDWVDWLMGYPIGWSALEATATDKYRYQPHWRFDYWLAVNGEALERLTK